MGSGAPEEGQDAVPQDFVDNGPVIQENGDHLAQIAVEKGNDLLGVHLGDNGGEAPQVRHDEGDLPGLAAHFQGPLPFQQLGHHFLGDVAPEGIPDEIPFFDVFGELLPQFIKGMGQVRHFPHPPLRHRHRKVALPYLAHSIPEPGDGPGEDRGEP